MTSPRLAIVVKAYPRLSETFIHRELAGLKARRVEFSIHSLRHVETTGALADQAVEAPLHYLPEYLHEAPHLVWSAWCEARSLPGYSNARREFLKHLVRDPTRSRVRRFGQACVLAKQIGGDVKHLHAHFLHSPCSVAYYAALIRNVGYSASAHAKDIWTTPTQELKYKLEHSRFVAVCNRAGGERLRDIAPSASLHLIHHGVSASLMEHTPKYSNRDGSDPQNPLRLICVARPVAKKGLEHLVRAVAEVARTLHIRLDHFGDGPLLSGLRDLTQTLGAGDNIFWHGPKPHGEVLRAMKQCDLFVLPALVDPSGDRDGIPNAILEAQASGVCCISTQVGSINETIQDDVTGVLVPPANRDALVRAILRLAASPADRRRLGETALDALSRMPSEEQGYDQIALLLRREIGI